MIESTVSALSEVLASLSKELLEMVGCRGTTSFVVKVDVRTLYWAFLTPTSEPSYRALVQALRGIFMPLLVVKLAVHNF